MRLVQFKLAGDEEEIVYFGAEIPTLTGVLPLPQIDTPFTIKEFLLGGPTVWQDAKQKVEKAELGNLIGINDIVLVAPILQPTKILGIGLNYRDGAQEQGKPVPESPIVFLKLPNTIMGPNDDLLLPVESDQVDWEVELALIIGQPGSSIEKVKAMEHVFGYAVAIDYTARDLIGKNGGLWTLAKNFPGFCPLGPAVVTSDEIADVNNLRLTTKLNDEPKFLQDSNTSNMIFGVEDLVSYVSRFMHLEVGDIILTGTPAGVGVARTPQRFLKKGDTVQCEIQNIGIIKNKII